MDLITSLQSEAAMTPMGADMNSQPSNRTATPSQFYTRAFVYP